jgi:hypothetical protein
MPPPTGTKPALPLSYAQAIPLWCAFEHFSFVALVGIIEIRFA